MNGGAVNGNTAQGSTLNLFNNAGGVYVELSRHSHDAVNTARKSKAFLDRFLAAR